MFKKTITLITICSIVFGAFTVRASDQATIKFYYTPIPADLNSIVINNVGYLSPNPKIGLNLMANSVLNIQRADFVPLSPTVWSAAEWTGLNPKNKSDNSQRAIRLKSDNGPSYGGTAFQVDGDAVGMHLNTYNLKPFPSGVTLHSLQYRVDLKKTVWDTNRGDLCANGLIDIRSSYSSGSVNQAMITLHFSNRTNPSQGFHFNVMMYDSRTNYPTKDTLHFDTDASSNGQVIVTSFIQTQNQNRQNRSEYTMPIPQYGNRLTPFISGKVQPGAKDWGFCTSFNQFKTILKRVSSAITKKTPQVKFSQNPQDYILDYVLVGPEMDTSKGLGRIGMTVHSFWVYQRS